MKPLGASDRVLLGAAVAAGVVAVALRLHLPAALAPHAARLQLLPTTLPFALRLCFAREVTAFVLLGCAGLLAAGVLARLALKSAGLGRALLTLELVFAAASVGAGQVGLHQAQGLCAWPAEGLRCCDCPQAPGYDPIECHCGEGGAVREAVFSRERFENGAVGDRLFYPPPRGESQPWREVVRLRALSPEAGEYVDGAARLACAWARPCPSVGPQCGACLPAPKEPRVFAIADGLSCLDARVGTAPLSGFVQVHRTVWPDETDGGAIPTTLDAAKALPSETSELIGSLGQLELATGERSADAVLGAGQAPRMRLGGVRVCRVRAASGGGLTGGLDEPLTTPNAIVRLEAVDQPR